MHLDRPMKVASRPAFSFFCFFPMRDSLRLEPILEWEAALKAFFLGFPLTRLPMVAVLVVLVLVGPLGWDDLAS